MKVIFLDFDGVLNHSKFFEQISLEQSGVVIADPDNMLDIECVCRLNKIIKETGAGVVVSSSWRLGTTAGALQKVLTGFGFDGKVIGKTPDLSADNDKERGDEIVAWLKSYRNPIESYIVIDDDPVDHVQDRQVKTSFHGGGLTDKHVEQAIALLSSNE